MATGLVALVVLEPVDVIAGAALLRDCSTPGGGIEAGSDITVLNGKRISVFLPAAAGILVLAAITTAAYSAALGGGFIWDDDAHVSSNSLLRSGTGLWQIWAHRGATPQYYPLTFSTFWVEYHLWGLNPAGYHTINVLLHALNAILLWLVLRRLHVPGAWIAAAVFAVHPIHVESVAWITERKNVLSGAFYLAAALAYLSAVSRPPVPTGGPQGGHSSAATPYVVALALFICALLSKTVTCTFPAAMLLVIWWQRGRITWADVKPLLPFFALGIGFGLGTVWMEKTRVGAYGPDWDFSLAERCLIAGRALWFYARTIIWPAPLIFVYPRWTIDAGVRWQFLYPLAAIAVAVGLYTARHRLGRAPLAAVLFFAGSLLPALGFFDVYPMRFSFVADHFAYLPSIGLICLVAAAATVVFRHTERLPRWLGPSLAVVTLVGLGTLTWQRTFAFENLETLWRDTLAKNPAAWIAHNNLGVVLFDQGRIEEAVTYYREALRQRPAYAEAHNNLGNALMEANRTPALRAPGQAEEAEAHYREAVRLWPEYAVAHANLAALLAVQGKMADAIASAQEAVRLRPGYVSAHYSLGTFLAHAGRPTEAVRHFNAALRLHPNYPEAHNNLGFVLFQEGRTEEGIHHYREALRLRPRYANALHNLGLALAHTGDADAAISQYEQALQIDPEHAESHRDLGVALAAQGRIDEAAQHLEHALRINPDDAVAQRDLAALRAPDGG